MKTECHLCQKIKICLALILIFLLFTSCQKISTDGQPANKKITYGIVCDPLTERDVINLGIRNNPGLCDSIFREIPEKPVLKSLLDSHRDNIGMSSLARILETTDRIQISMMHARRERRELCRKRVTQSFAADIARDYWKIITAEDHLDYLAVAEKTVAGRNCHLNLMRYLHQDNVSCLRTGLARKMGMGRHWSYTLVRPSAEQIISRLPDAKTLDITALEESALKNHAEIFGYAVRHDFVMETAAARYGSPELRLRRRNYSGDSAEGAEVSAKIWGDISAGTGKSLLGMSDGETGRYARLIQMSIIAQVNVAVLDYMHRQMRMRELFRTYASHLSAVMSTSCYDRYENTDPAVRAGICDPETVSVRFLRDYAFADTVIAHRRLLSVTGIAPDDWQSR